MVFLLFGLVVVLGRYLIVGYLDPQGSFGSDSKVGPWALSGHIGEEWSYILRRIYGNGDPQFGRDIRVRSRTR